MIIGGTEFIGRDYTRGDTSIQLELNDVVVIHHLPNHSQAKRPYFGKIIISNDKGGYDGKLIDGVVTIRGIYENDKWGAWINEYAFNRLQFISRGVTSIDLRKNYRVKEYNYTYINGWAYCTNEFSKSACEIKAIQHTRKTGLKTEVIKIN